ncbi:MAG: hypothetical protein KIS87_11655 [Phycisphaeraceae bacterium]|nr:hypothetical protein [Phycisphaeraceae bacterium]
MDGDDPWRWFVYDERWRVIAAYRGTDEAVESDAKERFVYHAAGFRSSGSYIDDVVLRDRDAVQPEADPANTDPADTWLFESDGVLEERVFICQNWRADAALVVDSSGAAVQRAWYTAYGVPTGADRADLNGDGVVDSADASVFSAWHGANDIRADWNLDGTINSTDTIAYLNAYNSAATLGGRGVLSSAALDLRAGYAGYRWDAFTQRYHVRHRVYEPYLGVWQSRDPAGYIDSLNLYEYAVGDPLFWRDPMGLGLWKDIIDTIEDWTGFGDPDWEWKEMIRQADFMLQSAMGRLCMSLDGYNPLTDDFEELDDIRRQQRQDVKDTIRDIIETIVPIPGPGKARVFKKFYDATKKTKKAKNASRTKNVCKLGGATASFAAGKSNCGNPGGSGKNKRLHDWVEQYKQKQAQKRAKQARDRKLREAEPQRRKEIEQIAPNKEHRKKHDIERHQKRRNIKKRAMIRPLRHLPRPNLFEYSPARCVLGVTHARFLPSVADESAPLLTSLPTGSVEERVG